MTSPCLHQCLANHLAEHKGSDPELQSCNEFFCTHGHHCSKSFQLQMAVESVTMLQMQIVTHQIMYSFQINL